MKLIFLEAPNFQLGNLGEISQISINLHAFPLLCTLINTDCVYLPSFLLFDAVEKNFLDFRVFLSGLTKVE